jgi:hypothetical protein
MLKRRWEEVVKPHNRLPYLKNVSVLSMEDALESTQKASQFIK